jgi:predicted DNA-binding transcriptional regulator YafY
MEKYIPVVVIKELSETDKILEALKNNLELSFVYRSKWEPLKNHRIVKPCQLIVDNGHIFLYAASSKNGILTRLYNLNRIQEVQILTTRTFDLPPDFKFEEDVENTRDLLAATINKIFE